MSYKATFSFSPMWALNKGLTVHVYLNSMHNLPFNYNTYLTLNGCVMACGAFHNIVTFLLYEASVWLILSSYIWHFSVLDRPKGIHDPCGNGINLLKKLLSSNTCIKYPLKKSYFPFDVRTTEKKLKMINLLNSCFNLARPFQQ